jgi:hypothetical protein
LAVQQGLARERQAMALTAVLHGWGSTLGSLQAWLGCRGCRVVVWQACLRCLRVEQQQTVQGVVVAEGTAAGGRAGALAAAGRVRRQGTARVLRRLLRLQQPQLLLGNRLMMRQLQLRGIIWGGLLGLRCLLMWRSWATTLRQTLGRGL